MRKITSIVFGLLIPYLTKGQSYKVTELDSIVEITYKYFDQGKCKESLPLLKETLKKCSGHSEIHRVTSMMMDCYFATSQYDKMLEVLNYGNRNGVVYWFQPFIINSLSNPAFSYLLLCLKQGSTCSTMKQNLRILNISC